MKFRTRDAVAALLATILARLVWTDSTGPESLSVSTVLAFYYEARPVVTVEYAKTGEDIDDDDDDAYEDDDDRDDDDDDDDDALKYGADGGGKTSKQKNKKKSDGDAASTIKRKVRTAPPVPFDVDGDGTVEGLIVPAIISNETNAWGLKVLDLKPLHGRRGAAAELTAFPFYPSVMFTTEGVEVDTAYAGSHKQQKQQQEQHEQLQLQPPVPIKVASGQVLLRKSAMNADGTYTTATGTGGRHKPPGQFVESDDRTRHYFCGTSWHDAAERCAVPCPNGQAGDCPDGEQCYAETPCDSQHVSTDAVNADDSQQQLILTPRNGLPSAVTLWSDGSITMHSLTGDYIPGGDRKKHRGKREKDATNKKGGSSKAGGGGESSSSSSSLLELRTMWRTNPFRPKPSAATTATDVEDVEHEDDEEEAPPMDILEFDEVDLIIDTTAPVGIHGAVIVAARYTRKNYSGKLRATTSYHAIDALDGTIIWSHGDKEGRGKLDPVASMGDALKFAEAAAGGDKAQANIETRAVSASARRRSYLPGATSAASLGPPLVSDDVTASEDCLENFRRWVMDPAAGVFPHVSWGSGRDDANIHVTHFDRKHQGQGWARGVGLGAKKGRGGQGIKKGPGGGKKMGWQKSALTTVSRRVTRTGTAKKKSPELESVRPNVILFRNREGVSVLSLRNGRPVCHLSLLDSSLYADINADGTLEQVQVITEPTLRNGGKPPTSSGVNTKAGEEASQTFVSDLINRAIKDQARGGDRGGGGAVWSPLCHILVLSGIPAREEVFSANLCSNKKGGPVGVTAGMTSFSAAPPLAVPGLDHPGMDIIFALNSRQVSRYDSTGNELWTTLANHNPIPSWGASGSASVLPLDFAAVTRGVASPAIRPLLVTGEDGAAVLSAGRGKLLSSVSFPQAIVSRPILADVTGDGTYDIIVVSTDAVWGYKVSVRASSASFLRILVGLLFMGIGLAALYNRFSQPPGADHRSTDA